MSNPTSIYVSNVKAINSIYDQLRKDPPKANLSKPQKITTPAGDFFLGPDEAMELFTTLQKWDKDDNKPDGKIQYAAVNKFSKEALPSNFGLKLSFYQFTPSKTWTEMREALGQKQMQGKLEKTIMGKALTYDSDHLWQATTRATLSELTSQKMELAESLCNAQSSCELYLGLYDENLIFLVSRNIPNPGGRSGLRIDWNLSDYHMDNRGITAWFTHEHGHRAFKEIATDASQPTFMHVILDWGKKSSKYGNSTKQFEPYLLSLGQGMGEIRYLTEEIADINFLREVQTRALEAKKREWLEENGPLANATPDEFRSQIEGIFEGSSHLTIASYLAAKNLYQGRAMGVDRTTINAYEKRCRELMKRYGPEAETRFNQVLSWSAIVDAYTHSDNFKGLVRKFVPQSILRSSK